MTRSPATRRSPARRGAAVVEFAVVVPILFLFLFGIIDYGRLIMVGQMTVNASREGARYAAQKNGVTVDQVKNVVRDYLESAGVAAGRKVASKDSVQSITVNAVNEATGAVGAEITNLPAYDSGQPFQVRVVIDFRKASWMPSGVVPSGTMMPGVTVMRKE